MAASEVEDTIKRIASHKGVQGILICNNEGVALKSTMPAELSVKYAGLFSQLIVKARSVVRTIDAEVRTSYPISPYFVVAKRLYFAE